jgi:hypothetical protein
MDLTRSSAKRRLDRTLVLQHMHQAEGFALEKFPQTIKVGQRVEGRTEDGGREESMVEVESRGGQALKREGRTPAEVKNKQATSKQTSNPSRCNEQETMLIGSKKEMQRSEATALINPHRFFAAAGTYAQLLYMDGRLSEAEETLRGVKLLMDKVREIVG